MLEEERAKNLQLETDIDRLETDLSTNKRLYERKLKDLIQALELESKTLNRAILDKAEECNSLTKKLSSTTSKHRDDVLIWSTRTATLDSEISKLTKDLSTYKQKLAKNEQLLLQTLQNLKLVKRQNSNTELELDKTRADFHAKHDLWLEEKQARMKLQVQVLDLELKLSNKNECIDDFEGQVRSLIRDNDDLNARLDRQAMSKSKEIELNAQLTDSRSTVRALELELDTKNSRVHDLSSQLQTMQDLQQRHTQRIAELCDSQQSARQLIETFKKSQQILHSEIRQLRTDEAVHLETIQRTNAELGKTKAQLKETEHRNTDLSRQVVHLQDKEKTLELEFQCAVTEKHQVRAKNDDMRAQLDQMQTQLQHAELVCANERKAVVDLKSALNKQHIKVTDMTHYIGVLEKQVEYAHTHSEAVKQTRDSEARGWESDKRAMHAKLSDLTDQVALLSNATANAESEIQTLRNERHALQDKLALAEKSDGDPLATQVGHLKLENETVMHQSELQAQINAQLKTHIHHLNNQIHIKDRELDLIKARYLAASQTLSSHEKGAGEGSVRTNNSTHFEHTSTPAHKSVKTADGGMPDEPTITGYDEYLETLNRQTSPKSMPDRLKDGGSFSRV